MPRARGRESAIGSLVDQRAQPCRRPADQVPWRVGAAGGSGDQARGQRQSWAWPGWGCASALGLGAHTAVHRAHRQGRDYAVKVLRDGSGGAAVLRAFRREAALLASVRHPGLPEVYEVGLAGTQPYLVMELLEGRSLRAALQAGPLDPVAVAGLGSRVAGAPGAAHGVGLVHRDVKPDNIV